MNILTNKKEVFFIEIHLDEKKPTQISITGQEGCMGVGDGDDGFFVGRDGFGGGVIDCGENQKKKNLKNPKTVAALKVGTQ
jgi:hypothetical protein